MLSRPAACGSPSVRVVGLEDEWDRLQSDWDALFATSPQTSTPLRFEWLRLWWRLYGASCGLGERPLRIVTVWRAGELAAVLPLYLGRLGNRLVHVRRLGLISTGDDPDEGIWPDYLNVMARPDVTAGELEALADAVAAQSWDHLYLLDIPEDSPLTALRDRLAGGCAAEVAIRGVCPIADLSGGFEAYLKRLSSRTRQHARQYLRAADRAGATLELADADSVERIFDDLIRLHQQRWAAEGVQGSFTAPRFTEFHRRLARQWVPDGRAVLGRLALGGQAIGVLYGFCTRGKFDYYQAGVQHESFGRLESPGTALILLLMRELIGRGIEQFDFLRGVSPQKTMLATDERTLVVLNAWRGTLRTRTFTSARAVRGRVLRLLKRRGRAPGSAVT